MTQSEIFTALMDYRNDSVRGDAILDEYFDRILGSVAKVLGLSSEQSAMFGNEQKQSDAINIDEIVTSVPFGSGYEFPDRIPRGGNKHHQEEAILKTHEISSVETGRKTVDNETIHRFLKVYGNDQLGYIASFEEWFSPNRAGEDKPEFYEVIFQTSIYKTAGEALADATPSTEMSVYAGFAPVTAQEPKPITINPSDYEITDGYIGSFGVTWKTATAETLQTAIEAAVIYSDEPIGEIEKHLVAGKPVRWCDSPNYYCDHSHGVILRKRTVKPVQLVECDCGHSVHPSQVMSASLGSSCPDCYDRMSD